MPNHTVRDDIIGTRVKVNLDTRVVALDMVDEVANTLEIQMPGYAIFYILDQINEMLAANPEMLTWRRPLPKTQ